MGDVDEVAADFPLEKANADFEARSGATGADVLVISGRPRYHVGGCEFVEGNDDSEPLGDQRGSRAGLHPVRRVPAQRDPGAQRGRQGARAGRPSRRRASADREPEPEPEPAPVAVSRAGDAELRARPGDGGRRARSAPVGDPQQNNHKTRRTPTRKPHRPCTEVSEPVAQAAAPAPPAPPPVATEPEPVELSQPAEAPAAAARCRQRVSGAGGCSVAPPARERRPPAGPRGPRPCSPSPRPRSITAPTASCWSARRPRR